MTAEPVTTSAITAVVPMKDPAEAKLRLAPVLSDEERRNFAEAMLQDTLAALASARHIADIVVVAQDPAWRSVAEAAGTGFLKETASAGYNAAAAFAANAFRDATALLILPGDLPLVTPAEIDQLTAPLATPGIRLAPDRANEGTNGILIAPPGLIATRFGPQSFNRHRQAAAEAGAACETVAVSGLAFDIDTPQDLVALCSIERLGETHTYLERSGIRTRFSAETPGGADRA